jgi:dienelactone hydrolase
MGVMGRFDEYVKTLLNVVQEAKGKWPRVQSWGAMGLCWGGKVCLTLSLGICQENLADIIQVRAMASQPGTPFKASGQVHPG